MLRENLPEQHGIVASPGQTESIVGTMEGGARITRGSPISTEDQKILVIEGSSLLLFSLAASVAETPEILGLIHP